MMARICEACGERIEQREFLQLVLRVLDPEEDEEQDTKEQAYGDFCDGCVKLGAALAELLKRIEWTLEPKHDDPRLLSKNQVICAAIKLKDGRIIRGHRHDSCFLTAMRIPDLNVPSLGLGEEGIRGAEQGFMTSENKFVDREEAMWIQKAAGIESIDGYRGDTLFSEDLY